MKLAVIVAHARAFGPPILARAVVVLALACWCGAIFVAIDPLNHFAPFWLALSLGAACVCLLAGRDARGWATYCAIAAIAHAGIMAPELLRPRSEPATESSAPSVRIVWLNTWLGGRASDDVLHYLETSDADFLLVSELHDEGQPHLERLRTLYPTAIRCLDGHGCNTIIFAKRAPTAVEARDDIRSAVGEFDIDGASLRLIAAHIRRPNPPGPQQQELQTLVQIIGDNPENVILAGDFNSTPWSFTLRRFDATSGLQRHTRALPTWPAQQWSRLRLPAPMPFLPIDHVYAGTRWRLVSVQRGPRTSSDHYPIEATFRFQ